MTTNNSQFYGINKGDAQVINTDGVLGQFGQMLAKQQAQRQLELKQLTDQQAQLKPDGLRNDADKQDFFNKANEWRQKKIAAMSERDAYKKSLLNSQADQAYMEAQSLVSQSKAQAVKDNAFQQFAMNNATRHQLSDNAIPIGLSYAKMGVNDPNLKPYDTLQRAPEYDYFDKLNTGINTQLQAHATPQDVYGKPYVTPMGNRISPVNSVSEPNKLEQATHYLNLATVDDRYKFALQSKYPQFFNGVQNENDLHTALAHAATQLANDTDLKVTKQKPSDKYDDSFEKKKEMWDYEGRHPHVSFTQQQANAPTYFQDLSERVRTEGKPKDIKSGALAELNQQVSQNPEYLHGLAYDWTNPKAVKILVPAKYKYDPKSVTQDEDGKVIPNSGRVIVKPAYSTVLDSTNPDQWTSGFSRIYKDLTGDASAVPTKAMTQYGKGKVPGGQSLQQAKHKKAASDYGL